MTQAEDPDSRAWANRMGIWQAPCHKSRSHPLLPSCTINTQSLKHFDPSISIAAKKDRSIERVSRIRLKLKLVVESYQSHHNSMSSNTELQHDVDLVEGESNLYEEEWGNGVIDFLDLPVDIVYIIFGLFTASNFYSIRAVCRGWRSTYWSIMTSFNWRMFAHTKFDGQLLYSLAKRFGSLRTVDLSNCETVDTRTISDALSLIPGLTDLNLAGTKVQSGAMIEALDHLPKLRRLNLSYTGIDDRVTNKICTQYGGSLCELRIDSCQVLLDSPHLTKLSNLEIMSLRQCRKIDRSTFTNMMQLKELTELNLINNSNCTTDLLQSLLDSLPKLKSLELGFVKTTPELIQAIVKKRLQTLTIHQLNKIDPKLIMELLGVTKNYTHKGVTFDAAMLNQLLSFPSGLRHVCFEGTWSSREVQLTFGPERADGRVPVTIIRKKGAAEFETQVRRLKQPKWDISCQVVDPQAFN